MRKIFLFFVLSFLFAIPCRGQIFDIPCPSPTTVTSSPIGQNINPVNGHLKAWLCIDNQANVNMPQSPTVAATTGQVTVSKVCPPSPSCFVVADDTQLVTDATWTATANVQVTISANDPPFQCPNGIYPCSGGISSATNDNGKSAQAGANCRAINPAQCDTSIPAGTIVSIQSATVATLSSTAATASNTGSGNRFFSWGTDDTSQVSAANDFCLLVKTGCTLSLPCGRMFYSSTSFTHARVTQLFPKPYFIDGHHCSEFIVSQNFNCTDINGCFMNLSGGAGQNPPGADAWADGANGIIFFTFFDTPAAGQFPGVSTYRLIGNSTYVRSGDIWVVGAFWNIATTRIVYGQSCTTCSLLDNNVSWSSGNRALYVSGAIQGTATISSGFYGNSLQHSCDIDGGNAVFLSGTQCNFPLSNNATEAGAGLDTLSTFTGQLWSVGSNIEGSPYLNGGTIHLMDFYNNPEGAASGIFSQNANVNLYIHAWHNAPNGGPWLHLSAGTVHFGCGNSPPIGFTGTNAAVITGGSLQVDSCSVGGDSQSAKTTAQVAKTIFTVGAGTTMYRAHLSVQCTTTSAAATVTPSILYTDTSNTAQTVTGTAANCAALGAASNTSQDVTFRAKNATAIQYQTVIANTPTYDVSVSVEQLSLN